MLFDFLFLFVVFNVFGYFFAGLLGLGIFRATLLAMDAIFLFLIILDVLGYLAACTFSTIVTSRSFFFAHGHFVVFLILHVVVHRSHHAFDLGQLGLYPFWQVVIVTQDLFQGLCMTHHSLDAVFGHVAFLVILTTISDVKIIFVGFATAFVFGSLAGHTLWAFVSAFWTTTSALFTTRWCITIGTY